MPTALPCGAIVQVHEICRMNAIADPGARRSIAFLNWAHALDHFVLLIYPTVVIGLEVVYQRPYSELIAFSSTAFVAFGIFSLPAGWLADRWSRRNMMVASISAAGCHWPPRLLRPARCGWRPACSCSACSRRSITRSAWRC